MIWDSTKGYQEYKESLGNIKNSLGLIDDSWFLINQELAPYITSILKWISGKLIELGENADIKEKLELIFGLFEDGSERIIALEGKSLAEEIGVTADEKLSSDDPKYLTYEQDRFIFSWTNILSSLVEHLKIQYASVLQDPIIQGCPCNCGKGETTKDWELYTSGVYPEDEEYSEYGLRGVPSTTSPIPECTCAYRK